MPVEMHSRTLRMASPGLSGPAALLITFSTSSSIACRGRHAEETDTVVKEDSKCPSIGPSLLFLVLTLYKTAAQDIKCVLGLVFTCIFFSQRLRLLKMLPVMERVSVPPREKGQRPESSIRTLHLCAATPSTSSWISLNFSERSCWHHPSLFFMALIFVSYRSCHAPTSSWLWCPHVK